jgi:hypothetical protein
MRSPGGGEHAGGFGEESRGQRRAVGIEHAGRLMPSRELRLQRLRQADAEIGIPRLQQPDVRRKMGTEEVLGPGRAERGIARDVGLAGGPEQVGGGVLQERRVAKRGIVEGQRRRQPRLGHPGARCLGHDGDTAKIRLAFPSHEAFSSVTLYGAIRAGAADHYRENAIFTKLCARAFPGRLHGNLL